MPILDDEENRPEFDIHAYTQRVVSSIENVCSEDPDDMVDFHAITEKCLHYDVCRIFLASLSLSNSGNVKLVHDVSDDCSSLGIQLLNSEIDRPFL